jgi:general secretion pathway protein D
MTVSEAHMDTPLPEADATADIPPVVGQVPIIAAPEPSEPLQTFTVVATDLPADELLFALARDARLNLDIDPRIEGNVSINAIDQTLPQILKRISRQVALRYYLDGPNLVIEMDRPFTRVYRIDYLNMNRQTATSIDVATQIASTGTFDAAGGGSSGGSNSSATVTNESNNDFWVTIAENIEQMASVDGIEGSVIVNSESGMISVRTTSAAHESIQEFIDTVIGSARRQVLIEATVVEVTLSDDFQAGVDWSRIAVGDGWSLSQNVLAETIGDATSPVISATYANSNSERDISGAIKALDSFGDVSVMSSPKIMALNNQTSILKVVDNVVYFTQDVDREPATDDSPAVITVDTTINTVPVGFVMNVTPFITDGDEIILNIRPTVSRILSFVRAPAVPTGDGEFIEQSPVPQIQVREMESVLRVQSGNTAVIGGLMQDSSDELDAGVPGLHDSKGFGLLFGTQSRRYAKTELVIFLRPRVIDNASLDTNLQDFRKFLKPKAFSKDQE